MNEDEIQKLKKENEQLKRKLKKTESRLESIIKMNDATFKNIFNKNLSLQKDSYRFNRILQQSDKQGKSILIQKEQQEQILHAQAKMALMGQMIDNIAHQWKQPLNSISMMIQTIIFKYNQGNLDDSIIDKFNQNSLKQIQYMSNTIDDFRNFLKEDKVLKYFRLFKTLNSVKLLAKNTISSNCIILETNINDEKMELYGIENEIIQVLMNLISNSNDAFDKSLEYKLIIIDVFKKDENTIIQVKDNAGGIDEEILNKIFESRFTTKKDNGGTGVGLDMSKKIIEKTFLGSISVENTNFDYENKTYKGALFTIKIPPQQNNS